MSEKFSERSEKPSENSDSGESRKGQRMNASVEAAELIRALAEPRPVGDTVKLALQRAARASGLSPTRAKAIWYREARRIDAEEIDALRAANEHRRKVLARLVVVRDAASASASLLDGESVARFVDMLRRMGAGDSAGASGGRAGISTAGE